MVGKAKIAAKEKDSGKLAESLKSAGKWALDVTACRYKGPYAE
jgi:hypothetical protein